MSTPIDLLVLALLGVALAGPPPRRSTNRPAMHHRRPSCMHRLVRPRRVDEVDGLLATGEQLARALRTGTSPRVAVCDLSGNEVARGALGVLRQGLRAGLTLEAAARHALRDEHPGVPRRGITNDDGRLLVHGLLVGVVAGGDVAGAVERAVASLRERCAFRREQHLHAAQSRLSALVLTLLPIVTAAWSLATSGRVRQVVLHSTAGPVLLGLGLAANLTGWAWMRHLIRRTQR